jgi:16S rRNA (uracil1498-N3)-methyltransferase
MANHRRFFIDPKQISGDEAVITGEIGRQIRTVLRLKVGDTIRLLDGSGAEHEARIASLSKSQVTARIVGTNQCASEPAVRLTLAVCVPKAGKLELVVGKCTELGISSVLLVTSERSVPRIEPAKAADRLARLQRIAVESAEQSGRGVYPDVGGIIDFAELPARIAEHELALLAWEDETRTTLKQALREHSGARSVMLIVGPEGGLTEREAQLARDAGARCVTLGKRTLRCETAAIAACAAVMYEFETS